MKKYIHHIQVFKVLVFILLLAITMSLFRIENLLVKISSQLEDIEGQTANIETYTDSLVE